MNDIYLRHIYLPEQRIVKVSLDDIRENQKLYIERMANVIKFIERSYGMICLSKYHGHDSLTLGRYIITAKKSASTSDPDEYSIDFNNRNDISAFKLLYAFDSINKAGFKIWLNYERNGQFYEKIFGNLEELAIEADLES